MHSVCKLAQRNCDPHQEHELAAKHILRYLSKTIDLKLRYQKTGQRLHAYVDADWANSILDRKSYTGYGFFYGGSVISCRRFKQHRSRVRSVVVSRQRSYVPEPSPEGSWVPSGI
ncbi:uncharacterized protein [Drosophila kikkawai]|uniref:Uncharacterized protein n=1 Tax=Drosophila kikkawai TaxID=30033 RepID=A0ABM4GQ63_DROKI